MGNAEKKSQQSELERMVDALQLDLSHKNARLAEVQNELQLLHEELGDDESVRSELARLRETYDNLRTQLLSKEAQLSQERRRIQRLSEQLTEVSAELHAARTELQGVHQAHHAQQELFQQVVNSASFRVGKRLTETVRRIPGGSKLAKG